MGAGAGGSTSKLVLGMGPGPESTPIYQDSCKKVETLEKTWKMLKNVETIGLAALSGWPF